MFLKQFYNYLLLFTIFEIKLCSVCALSPPLLVFCVLNILTTSAVEIETIERKSILESCSLSNFQNTSESKLVLVTMNSFSSPFNLSSIFNNDHIKSMLDVKLKFYYPFGYFLDVCVPTSV